MKLLLIAIVPALLFGQEPASVSGQVVNTATGEPVRKVELVLNGSHGSLFAVSDSNGYFEFPKVDPGDYGLEPTRAGFALADIVFGGKIVARGQSGTLRVLNTSVKVAAGDHLTGYVVRMNPYGAIAGKVTDADGDPIRNMTVTLMRYRYTPSGRLLLPTKTATTDDRGEYRLYDVSAGRYYIRAGKQQSVSRAEAEVLVTTFYANAPDLAAATPLDLRPGQELRADFTLRKKRLAAIRGRVVAPEGAINLNASLLTPSPGSIATSTAVVIRNPRDGKFELYGVAPGRAFLAGSYTLEGRPFTVQMPIDIGAEDINDLEVRPLPPGQIPVRVIVDSSTATAPRVTFDLVGPNAPSERLVMYDNSSTFIEVEAGIYEVVTMPLASPFYVKAIRWGDADITEGKLDLSNGVPSRVPLTIVLGADAGEVSGTVTDDDAAPASIARVVLVPANGHRLRDLSQFTFTSPNGSYSMHGVVAPGEYKLYAWDDVEVNAARYDPEFLIPYASVAQTVRVDSKGRVKQDLKLIVNKTLEAP